MFLRAHLPAFLPSTPLPSPFPAARAHCPRAAPHAKKGGGGAGGKKRAKPSRSKRISPRSPPASSSAPSPPADPAPTTYPGPLAPELLRPDAPLAPAADVDIALPADDGPLPPDAPVPLPDEARLRLPDLAAPTKGVRRKRKPRAADRDAAEAARRLEELTKREKDALPTDRIRELTAAYRTGGEGADVLISEIEKDPDFMFQTGNPDGEYDLTSAIIGTGSPNKQGVYVLPYLQSGHLLLLLVVLLCTFVYYPGFPLTELDDSVRTWLKRGLGLTYTLNAALAVLAYRNAKERKQPAAFWALKTAFFGNLAFNELRRNAPMQQENN